MVDHNPKHGIQWTCTETGQWHKLPCHHFWCSNSPQNILANKNFSLANPNLRESCFQPSPPIQTPISSLPGGPEKRCVINNCSEIVPDGETMQKHLIRCHNFGTHFFKIVPIESLMRGGGASGENMHLVGGKRNIPTRQMFRSTRKASTVTYTCEFADCNYRTSSITEIRRHIRGQHRLDL